MQCEAITVENLHVRYRPRRGLDVHAVENLSFTVQPGEIVGFLGPNGAGKSSTIKALMGFLQPSSGRCHVFGHPSGSVAAKRRVGYLPEVALYYPYLTPFETLRLYGELQGLHGKELKAEIIYLLDSLGIYEAAHKLNRTLSKGMLQRVGIAQALLGSPELLVLDEVTSGLDPVGRKELRSILKSRQEGGCTLFFSSHELSEVDMLCDRILVIERGRLIEERQLDSLKEELRRYEIVYRGVVSLVGLTEDWHPVESGVFRARFDSKDSLLQAVARVQQHHGEVIDLVAEEGSLEDYFIETIGRAA